MNEYLLIYNWNCCILYIFVAINIIHNLRLKVNTFMSMIGVILKKRLEIENWHFSKRHEAN